MALHNNALIDAISSALYGLSGEELTAVALAATFSPDEIRDLGGLV